MPTLIEHKKARFNYTIDETFEAGIELFGFETKSLRNHQGSLNGSYCIIRGGEAFLVNAYIPPYQEKNAPEDYDPYRPRRLLLNKDEIGKLAGAERQKSLTIVPLSVYTKGRYIKMEIGIAKGKKKHDKRETIKKRDIRRETMKEVKDMGM